MFYCEKKGCVCIHFRSQCYFWKSGAPKCSSGNWGEIEENLLYLAAVCAALTPVLYWAGKLWEFSEKSLILHAL